MFDFEISINYSIKHMDNKHTPRLMQLNQRTNLKIAHKNEAALLLYRL